MNTLAKQSFTVSQRESLIQEWKQSGKSKKGFCEEKGLKYMTFVTWKAKEENKNASVKDSFLQVEVKNEPEAIFAKLSLHNGTVVYLYQAVEVSYLSRLIK